MMATNLAPPVALDLQDEVDRALWELDLVRTAGGGGLRARVVDDGKVELSGFVRSRLGRDQVLEKVRSVPGVVQVIDRTVADPGARGGGRRRAATRSPNVFPAGGIGPRPEPVRRRDPDRPPAGRGRPGGRRPGGGRGSGGEASPRSSDVNPAPPLRAGHVGVRRAGFELATAAGGAYNGLARPDPAAAPLAAVPPSGLSPSRGGGR